MFLLPLPAAINFSYICLEIIDFSKFLLVSHWEIRKIKRPHTICIHNKYVQRDIESLMYLYATVITVNDDQTTDVLCVTTTKHNTRFYGLFTPSATANNRVTKY